MTTSLGALLDELPAHAAVIAADGTIIGVNRRWHDFAVENGAIRADNRAYGLGLNYLEVCARSSGDPFADEAQQALRSVLERKIERFAFTYPCHCERRRRWFFCLFLAVPQGAVVLHFDHRQQMDGHRLMNEAEIRIRALGLQQEVPLLIIDNGAGRHLFKAANLR